MSNIAFYGVWRINDEVNESVIMAFTDEETFNEMATLESSLADKWIKMNGSQLASYVTDFCESSYDEWLRAKETVPSYGRINIKRVFAAIKNLIPLDKRSALKLAGALQDEDQWNFITVLVKDKHPYTVYFEDDALYDYTVTHEDDEEDDMEESYVSGDGGFTNDTTDFIESMELTGEDFIMETKLFNESLNEAAFAYLDTNDPFAIVAFDDITTANEVVAVANKNYGGDIWVVVPKAKVPELVEAACEDFEVDHRAMMNKLRVLVPADASAVQSVLVQYNLRRSMGMLESFARLTNGKHSLVIDDETKEEHGIQDDDEMDESYIDGSGYGGDSMDVIESDDEDTLYGGMPEAEFHDWVDNGNPVRFKPGTGYERPGVWNPSQLNVNHNRCWVGDENDRGWYVSLNHLVPHYEDDEELDEGDGMPVLTAEDFILPRNQSKSLADEVEKHDDENGEPEDQAYISRLRNLAGLNKI